MKNLSYSKGNSFMTSGNTSSINNISKDQRNMSELSKEKLNEKINHPVSTKFKSLFDREGNPFKYFQDIKKHLNSNSSSSSLI